MQFDEKDLKTVFVSVFTEWGFSAREIEEQVNVKTPDLYAEKDGDRYAIEIKTRLDNLSRVGEENLRLRRGEIVSHAEPIVRRNTLSGIIRQGDRQLAAYPECDFRLLLLLAAGEDPGVQSMQFHATLYGTTGIIDVDGTNPYRLPCYYFYNSDFYRLRDTLDGAILVVGDTGELLLNDQSPRVDTLKNSAIGRHFGTSILDPRKKEQEGKAYIADCDLDRQNRWEILRYLQRKYGIPRLNNIDLVSYSARILG